MNCWLLKTALTRVCTASRTRSGWRVRSSSGTRTRAYFTTPNSARRFLAQAASLFPGSAGISSPKLTV